jgi:hypothetical protein
MANQEKGALAEDREEPLNRPLNRRGDEGWGAEEEEDGEDGADEVRSWIGDEDEGESAEKEEDGGDGEVGDLVEQHDGETDTKEARPSSRGAVPHSNGASDPRCLFCPQPQPLIHGCTTALVM